MCPLVSPLSVQLPPEKAQDWEMDSAMKSMSHEVRDALWTQLSHVLSGSSGVETPHLSALCSETMRPWSERSILLREVGSCCDAEKDPAARGVPPPHGWGAGGQSLTSGPKI